MAKNTSAIAILLSTLVLFAYLLPEDGLVTAGPISAGICYGGCAAVVVACFAAAGFTFGTVPGTQIAVVPALASCNSAFAICESACMVALAVPIP